MTLDSFFKLVEIQTKVASIIPFIFGTLFSLYRFKTFNLQNFILMLLSLLAFDMATTAINNYVDYKKARKKHGFNYETHNAIVKFNLKESTVVGTIVLLIMVAVICGIILFLNTNYIVLLLGALSFGIGVVYSFGPLPISRMPLGEIFSGFFMGCIIPFIAIYIHIYDKNFIGLALNQGTLNISLDMITIGVILLISIPTIGGIANIMLANNICDIEDDLENRRYTLPIYIGKEKALKLFKFMYLIGYVDIAILVLTGVLPIASLATLLTYIPVMKNIEAFNKKQTKKDTFILAVKNFVLINVAQIALLAITLIVTYIAA